MADVPSGYTSNYNIAKWNDGDNPGAAALNNNWDLIDAAILAAYNEGGAVDSVFGRTGAVIAAQSDYDASQVDNDSTVSGAQVSDALDTLLGLTGGEITLGSDNEVKFLDGPGGTPITTVGLTDTLYINTQQDISEDATPTFYQVKSSNEATGTATDFHIAMFDENGYGVGKGGQLWFTENAPDTDYLTLKDVDLKFNTSGNIGTANYSPETTGWNINFAGQADFRYLYSTEMHVRTFVADMEQALAGSQIISKSVAIIYEDFTLPAISSSGTLKVEAFDGYNTLAVFDVNDWIRLRQMSRSGGGLTVADAWVQVDAYLGNGVGSDPDNVQQFTVTRRIGGSATGTISGGTLALDYGVAGDGYIEQVAYSANGPYHQIVTWTSSPASALRTKTKMGSLDSHSTTNFGTLSGWGFWSEKVYLENDCYVAGNLWALTGGFGGTKAAPAATINSYGLAIEDKTKGNVTGSGTYIGNWQSTTGFYGTILNQDGLYGYYNNTNIFKVDTSGALLAGFAFADGQIINDNFEIGINGTETYLKMWDEGFSSTHYVKLFYNSSGDSWGIEGKYGGDYVFQLGDTNKIAGWTFTDTEFSNSNVSLEVGTFSGLAVSNGTYDIVRIGETAGGLPSGLETDVSSSVIQNTGFASADTGDPLSGWDINNGANCATCDINTTNKNLEILGGSKSASLTGLESEIIQDLDSTAATALEGKKIKVSFTIKRTAVASSDADYRIRLTIKRNSTDYLLQQDIDVSDVGSTVVTKEYNIDASDITDIDTNGFVQFMVYADKNVAHIYDTFIIDSLIFKTYTETNITHIDEDGIWLYRSPFDQLKLTATESNAHFTSLKVNNFNVGRFVGVYNNASDLPSLANKLGDYGVVLTGSSAQRLYVYCGLDRGWSYVDLT